MHSNKDKKSIHIAELIKRKLEAYISELSPELKGQISLMLDPVSLSIQSEDELMESLLDSREGRRINPGKCRFVPCFNGCPFPDSKIEVSWEKGKIYFDRKAIFLFLKKRKNFLSTLAKLEQQPLPYLTCFALKFKPDDEVAFGLFKNFLRRLGIILRESELRELLYSECSRLMEEGEKLSDYNLSDRLAELVISKAEFKTELGNFINYIKDKTVPFKFEVLEKLIRDAKSMIRMEKFGRKLKMSKSNKGYGVKNKAEKITSISTKEVAEVIDEMLIARGLWGLKLIYFCLNYQAKDTVKKKNSKSASPVKPKKKKLDKSSKSNSSPINLSVFLLFKIFDQDDLTILESICQKENLRKDEVIYSSGQKCPYLFLINHGEIRVSRETSYGKVDLSKQRTGDFLGEEYFISRINPVNKVTTTDEVTLYKWEVEKLKYVFKKNKFLATKFYWVIWQSLAIKLRKSNEELEHFFKQQISQTPETESKEDWDKAKVKEVKVDERARSTALRVKGLSEKEMELLAQMGKEEFYPEKATIFNEGDKGDSLYIIINGEVRISKYIPGIGEEALAILEKGDYFGEMALVDAEKRSADAIVHSKGATLLSLSRKDFNDILSSDINIADKFIDIICRILAERLLELHEKTCQWKIMAGIFE